jgi:hypothetical protein
MFSFGVEDGIRPWNTNDKRQPQGSVQMKIKSSKAIEKIVNMDSGSRLLTGYIYQLPDATEETSIRLYPRLSPNQFYEIDPSSVVDVIEVSGDSERRTLVLREDARLYLVNRVQLSSCDLDNSGDDGWTPLRGRLPPYADRLRAYLMLAIASLLEGYLGTESIPGTGQSGNPIDDL